MPGFTPGDLLAYPAALAAVLVAGGVMGLLDSRVVFAFGRLDRAAVEAVLDRAEHWLGSWKAPAVRALSFGLIHPRRIVGEQVRQALVDASLAVNGRLWAPFKSWRGSPLGSPGGSPGRPPVRHPWGQTRKRAWRAACLRLGLRGGRPV